MMNRLEEVRNEVDKILLNMTDDFERRCAYLHLYGVSQLCSMIAIKRGLDPEISAISGMLHDIYSYKTNIHKYHSHNSAEDVRPLLRDMNLFTMEEQMIILSAIFHHSDKGHIHDGYDEILKDADTLQHYLYNTNYAVETKEIERLKSIRKEFEIPIEPDIKPQIRVDGEKDSINRNELMADIAEKLAEKVIKGERDDLEFIHIVKHWTDKEDIYTVLKNSWCAVFVYKCAMMAGITLPIRHPKTTCRFAGVKAWYEWANIPEINFYYKDIDDFIPQRGDIIIYDNIIPEENKPKDSSTRDHIGIVLSCNDDEIYVAEGNINNQNQSGIIKRKRFMNIDGYIRIPQSYQYDGWKYDYKTGKIRIVPYISL